MNDDIGTGVAGLSGWHGHGMTIFLICFIVRVLLIITNQV